MNHLINDLIAALNGLGGVFCNYAGSVFVQSGVLIVLLLFVDLLIRRRVRATLRYWIWMLVFVKLVLPPSLSLPTGIGYWRGEILPAAPLVLQQTSRVIEDEPAGPPVLGDTPLRAEAPQVQLSQTDHEPAGSITTALSPLNSPTWQAAVFVLWLAGVLVLSALLIQRMLYVRRLIVRSEPAENSFIGMLNHCREQVGARRPVELRVSNSVSSPAVCGLFKPVILMPAAPMEKLPQDKLRAVLFHELCHIKRGDLWINSAQTVLQIIYFYNPLVWLANVVVRRIREQAVDEMVLVTLGAGAKDYSNTLIDIAETAFLKTSLSLRLIGVVESKKALHRRIRHMLNRPIPKSTRMGVFRTIVIIIIAAVLLPMAKAQKLSEHEAKAAKPLHQAAAAGDIEQVKSLISKGTDINEKDENGWSPLHSAAWNGRNDVAELLLAKGANVNATDVSGRTPLHLAVTFAEGSVVDLLIAKGANVNARDNAGNTPLHAAAGYWEANKGSLEELLAKGAEVNARNDNGQTPLHIIGTAPTIGEYPEKVVAAIFLLANGAEVNAKDKNGCTPLYVAAENGRRNIAEVLLGRGAIINEKTNDGLTALHRAAMLGRKDVVELLLSRIGRYDSYDKGIYATDSRGWTAMHHAARGGYNDVISLLIDYDADLNPKTTRGETPVHLAVVQNQLDTVKLLISKGANVSTIHVAAYIGDLAKVKSFTEKGVSVKAQDGFGLTPLHAAAGAGRTKVAEFLISRGAAVNADAVAEGPGTPLHYAADAGSREVTELLISKGAIIDSRNRNGETPLHLAAQKGYNDLARLFIANNADVNARAQNRWTPLHFAADNGNKDIAALLVENGADINAAAEPTKRTPLLFAAQGGHKDVVKLLIEKGADVSPVDELLFRMCEHGHRDLAEFFIKKGADVNAENAWGNAPSLFAVWNNHPDILKLLLDHGANPDARDRWDWSLLHYTIDSRCRSLDMTRMLLEKGANPNAKITDDGSTPFYWAVGYDLKEVVDLFITKGADVNAKGNNEGRTALHEASEDGNKDMAEFLIAKGADVNAKDNNGRTALSLAKEEGQEEIVELLKRHGAKE